MRSEELLGKEEESLRKKLAAYNREIDTCKNNIRKRKEEMLQPESNKEILFNKKHALELEIKELKKKIKITENTGIRNKEDGSSKHHNNYNNEYLFNYKSKGGEMEEEGWSGQLSKEFRNELELGEKLDKKIKIIQKEKMDIRVRLKKEIDYFFEKKDRHRVKEGTGNY
jgi:hypothetical protein